MHLTTLVVALLMLTPALAVSQQVSGVPEAAALAAPIHPTCDLGPRVGDSQHPEHTCPAAFAVNECWWVWHIAADEHGHPVLPFRDEETVCAAREGRVADCGPASDRVNGRCVPHPGAHVTDKALAEYCRLFGCD